MYALIEPFLKLLLFRAGPQDVPPLMPVFKIAIFSCFLTDVLGAMKTLGPGMSVFLSAGQIALLAGCVYLLLKFNQKSERWLQTLTAIFGTLAIINLASYPFIQNLQLLKGGQLVLTPGIMFVGILQLWFFVTMSRILRDALETRMSRAVLFTFLIINFVPIILSMFVGALGLEANVIGTVNPDSL